MYGILHWYNTNRKKIWTFIAILVMAVAVIQLLKYITKLNTSVQGNAYMPNNDINKSLNSITLEEGQSLVTGENLSSVHTNLLKVMDEFVACCNENNIKGAYELLSDECKQQMYPTIDNFKLTYYDRIFNGEPKSISAENWIGNTYKVKYVEDSLATGKFNKEGSIQDYITLVVDKDGNTKMNINSYIGKLEFKREKSDKGITIKVLERNTYMDYQTYIYEVTNDTDNTVLINEDNNIDTMYLEDTNNIKYFAYNHEISEAQLRLAPKEKKKITIKYYNKYSSSKVIENIVFSRIILNYEVYSNYPNKAYYNNYATIQIIL